MKLYIFTRMPNLVLIPILSHYQFLPIFPGNKLGASWFRCRRGEVRLLPGVRWSVCLAPREGNAKLWGRAGKDELCGDRAIGHRKPDPAARAFAVRQVLTHDSRLAAKR